MKKISSLVIIIIFLFLVSCENTKNVIIEENEVLAGSINNATKPITDKNNTKKNKYANKIVTGVYSSDYNYDNNDINTNLYVYNYILGSDFDESFILECIAKNKTPYICISFSKYNEYDLGAIQQLSRQLSKYYVDCYIELCPSPTYEEYNKEEYIKFFEKSSDIFKTDIKNAYIVFTPSTKNLYTSTDFTPNPDYFDFVGFEYIGYITPDNEGSIYNDFFAKFNYVYKAYENIKPIFITKFAVSHYTEKNHSYYITENIEYMNEVFEILLNDYPKLSGINFYNVDARLNKFDDVTFNEDNYKFTEDNDIFLNLKKYIK